MKTPFIISVFDIFTGAVQSWPLPQTFLVFLIYSFIGWCCEVAYVGIFFEHKFINRGFLHGPICPIYGCGGMVMLFMPVRLKNTWIPLFFAGMFLCSAIEYFVSWGMERLFQTRWWDYSNRKFNINGRICLQNSLLFGVMTLVVEHFIQPAIDYIVYTVFDETFAVYLADVLAVIFIIDILRTLHKLVDFSTTMAKLKEFGESLKERYGNETWFRGGSISEMFASIKEHNAEEKGKFSSALLEKIEAFNAHHSEGESLINKFPRMYSRNYNDSLALMKKRLEDNFMEKKAERAAKHAAKKEA